MKKDAIKYPPMYHIQVTSPITGNNSNTLFNFLLVKTVPVSIPFPTHSIYHASVFQGWASNKKALTSSAIRSKEL